MTDGRNPDLDEQLIRKRFADIGFPVEEAPLGRPNYRIEALRAASRVTADIPMGDWPWDTTVRAESIIELAEQFARWLEEG